jgi:hypothetical protein
MKSPLPTLTGKGLQRTPETDLDSQMSSVSLSQSQLASGRF